MVPGHATPGQYVKEITVANDGIVNQRTLTAYARNSFPMIEELDSWGVKFEKDETSDYLIRFFLGMLSDYWVFPEPVINLRISRATH